MIEPSAPLPHVGLPDRLKAAVLDWAGTTVDFGSRAPVVALMAAFEQAGAPITEAQARGPMGRAKPDHIREVLSNDDVAARWRLIRGRDFVAEDVDAIYHDFVALQKQCVADLSDLIPGCADAVNACRNLGVRIGSSTGYTHDLLDPIAERAKAAGYEPEVSLCADDVSPGRPAPWLCFENARRLGVYPMAAVVKVDDTPAGVLAGRNAGAWAVGVVASGNEVGLSAEQYGSLSAADRDARIDAASRRLLGAGAHFLIETIAELPAVVDRINRRLADRIGPG